jgi:hypothetical protein
MRVYIWRVDMVREFEVAYKHHEAMMAADFYRIPYSKVPVTSYM